MLYLRGPQKCDYHMNLLSLKIDNDLIIRYLTNKLMYYHLTLSKKKTNFASMGLLRYLI